MRAAVVAHGLSQDRSSAPSRRTPAFALPRTEPATFDRPHPAPGGVDVAGLGLAILRVEMDKWDWVLEEVDHFVDVGEVRIGVAPELTVELAVSARAGAWALAGASFACGRWGLAACALAAVAEAEWGDAELVARAAKALPNVPEVLAALTAGLPAAMHSKDRSGKSLVRACERLR